MRQEKSCFGIDGTENNYGLIGRNAAYEIGGKADVICGIFAR